MVTQPPTPRILISFKQVWQYTKEKTILFPIELGRIQALGKVQVRTGDFRMKWLSQLLLNAFDRFKGKTQLASHR